MSQKAYTYATTKDTGSPARQLLLYVIAEYTNTETGTTFCKIKTLMRDTKIRSDKTLRTHLKRLERDGFIRRVPRFRDDGGKTSDVIELVGFIDWATRSGVDCGPPPVKVTGGGEKPSKQQPPPVNRLPDPPGNMLTGPPGKQVTGLSDQSSNQEYYPERARENLFDFGTDGSAAQPGVFTKAVLAEIALLGLDASEIVERYAKRTAGRTIADPSAYLLQIARDVMAKKTGVPVEHVKRMTSRNRHERIEAAADATMAYSRPSDAALAKVRNCASLEEILAIIAKRKFRSQMECDRAFEGEVVNARFRPPGRSVLTEAKSLGNGVRK